MTHLLKNLYYICLYVFFANVLQYVSNHPISRAGRRVFCRKEIKMKWKEIIRAMKDKAPVCGLDPINQVWTEECTVKKVYLFCRASGRLSIGAELWGKKSTYNMLAKNVKRLEEVGYET